MVKCNTNLKLFNSFAELYDACKHTNYCTSFEKRNGYPYYYVLILNGDYYHFGFNDSCTEIISAIVFSPLSPTSSWQTITQEDFNEKA